MLAPPQRHRERHKRPRSPSPASEPDLASPVDVILKRRRRDELQYSSPIGSGAGATAAAGNDISPFVLSPHGPGIANHTEVDYFNLPPTGQYAGRDDQGGEGVHAESSAAALRRSMAGVERRRTKQWEKQNAPQPSTTASQPTPPPAQFLTPNARSAYSQPNPMSSSPIRNVPPSSSPFRDKGDTSWLDVTLRHDQSLMDLATGIQAQDEEMNEEEMKREWGDEYAVQNSLLHNLHLARMQAHAHPHPSRFSHASHPAHPHSMPHTPSHLHSQTHLHHHPYSPATHPFNSQATSSQHTLISTPTLASPQPHSRPPGYLQSPSHVHAQGHSHSYRQQLISYPDSSPFSSQLLNSDNFDLRSPSVRSAMHAEGDDEAMECLTHTHEDTQSGFQGYEGEDEVKRRYEEANRLLGELEVVRRKRWGEAA